MKHVILKTLPALLCLVAFSSCLKDKGFENGQYGTNVNGTRAVAFPKAGNAIKTYALDVSAQPQTTSKLLAVTIESDAPAVNDVVVSLTNTTGTIADGDVKAYNDANPSTPIEVLPAGLYSVPLSLTIPAGSSFAKLEVELSNTTGLDPTVSYGLGLTISAASGGYEVASNMKKMLVIFSLKNRLDGIYEISGEALRAGDPVLSGAFGPYERTLLTSGANAVQWQGQVLWANGSSSALPDGFEPLITVDPATNLVTDVSSASGIQMTDPIVRTDIVSGTQHYDPAARTLYFEFTYGAGPASRLFSFKAKWLRDR